MGNISKIINKQELSKDGRLCIVAGAGGLPKALISNFIAKNIDFFVLALHGFTDADILKDTEHAWVRLGAVGEAFNILHSKNINKIVMAGRVRRPSLKELRPDMRGMAFFAKLGIKALGDDGLLKAVSKELESEGFQIIAAHKICKDLTVKSGDLGKYPPRKHHIKDIRHGWNILDKMSELDIGQAIAVQEGIVIALEAVEGTDVLIKRAGEYKRKGSGPVLVKRPKKGQDRRFDMPTIGLDTVKNAIDAGFSGIAIAADETIFLDRKEAIKLADKAGIFITAIGTEDII